MNWYAVHSDNEYAGLAAAASGNQVTVTLTLSGVLPGPDFVSFRPPPFDVLSDLGVQAEAFEEYPIT